MLRSDVLYLSGVGIEHIDTSSVRCHPKGAPPLLDIKYYIVVQFPVGAVVFGQQRSIVRITLHALAVISNPIASFLVLIEKIRIRNVSLHRSLAYFAALLIQQ